VRGLISALIGPDTEVPSPTYTLVQTYETPDGLSLHHLDLYRLKSPDEVIELGWEDLATGVRLVEWPARAGPYWPASALAITLTPSPTSPGRLARLCGAREAWQDRLHALALALTPSGEAPADDNGACTP
jgi:tRNA threonylcarbamoyl adenosine modification protein YjeE